MATSATTAATANADELTREDAAKLLHLSCAQMNMLVATGQLADVRKTAGGEWRISVSEILEYKAASKKRRTKSPFKGMHL